MEAQVINLVERRATASDAVLNQVEAYWDGLRNGRLAPTRGEVSPRGLTNVLSRCFILERVAPGYARFRVFGRHVGELTGSDLRNIPITALFFAEDRPILEETIAQVFDRPAAARLAIESPPGIGRERLTCRMALLPLRDDLGQMTRILGSVSMDGQIDRTPRRLAITGKTLTEVRSGTPLRHPTSPVRPRGDLPVDTGTVVKLPLSAD